SAARLCEADRGRSDYIECPKRTSRRPRRPPQACVSHLTAWRPFICCASSRIFAASARASLIIRLGSTGAAEIVSRTTYVRPRIEKRLLRDHQSRPRRHPRGKYRAIALARGIGCTVELFDSAEPGGFAVLPEQIAIHDGCDSFRGDDVGETHAQWQIFVF